MSMVTNLPQKLETLKTNAFHFGILKDITSSSTPVDYSVKELQKHELPVIGTFVHSHILPGFRYRVRLAGTNEFLFGGKAMKVESIGQGYGKRITFESADILENNNFFWSDSHEAGFAFSPELLSCGDVFRVLDSHGKDVGTFSVTSVDEEQHIMGVTHEKESVNVHGKLGLHGNIRLASQTTSELVVGEVSVKVNRFSCTLNFAKTEYGGSMVANDSALQVVKHFQ